MTAINAAIQPDGARGFMLTDSAICYPGEAVVGRFGPKFRALPGARAVIACTGLEPSCLAVFDASEKFTAFDQMAIGLPVVLRILGEAAPEAVALGWSETARAVRMFISREREKFAPQWCPMFFTPGGLSESDYAASGLQDQNRTNYDHIPDSLLFLMQRQRARHAVASGSDRLGIGGKATLVTITSEGVTTRTFHRFGDKIGSEIAGAA